jgi:prepilin-type N-terminal cleavage/methylation domain-containing protein
MGNGSEKVKGFTLIELIVVIAIISVLAAIIAPNAFRAIEKAKVSQAVADYKAIKTANYALYSDTGSWSHSGFIFGDNRTDLLNDNHSWSGWDGPYLDTSAGRHPWAGKYWIGLAGNKFGGINPATYDYIVGYDDYCYPNGPGSGPRCAVPEDSAVKIDRQIDDGDLFSGNFRRGSGTNYYDMGWLLIGDFAPALGW